MKKEAILSYFPNITQKRFGDLLQNFNSWKEIQKANTSKLKNKLNWKQKTISKFTDWKNKIDIDKKEQVHDQENIHCLTRDDNNYPPLLKEIHDPPYCLFVRGEINPDDFFLGVVGTRKYSKYGKQITNKIVKKLAKAGITIVSGLAYGIDSFAHKATLEASGKTIAVLGGGNNDKHVYPAKHKGLAKNIANSNGAVITEYAPGTQPTRYTFPKRNRIIAGICKGVIVMEAGENSGSLITSDCALNENREVFTVPHNITSKNGVGPNELIKQGAVPITSAQDVLDHFHLEFEPEDHEIEPDSKEERKILKELSEEPTHIDKIIKNTELNSDTVNSTISMMEIKGMIKNLGNMEYVIST